MDDSLLAEFHAVFSVSGDVNSPSRPHPNYSSLYKYKREGFGEQEARRRRLLEQQRSRRRNYVDYVRKIAEGETWEEEMEEEGEGGGDEVDLATAKITSRKKKIHPYRNQLMLSEWLVDVPEDFTENWFVTVCPVGKRSLVVSNKGTTVAYSRSGAQINCFPSVMPGGCIRTLHTHKDYCILDCIYHESSRTFFVLDIMCWRAHPVYDTDREFRFYWLRTKLSECKGINEISRINPYKFVALDSFSSSKDSLAALLSKPWPLEVDGLLFFHKLGHYLSRQSPLVVWLKPHMVTDILGVPVSDEFLACAPRMSDPLATPTRKGRGQERDKGSDGPTSQLEAGHNTTTIEMDSELSTQS